MNCTIKHTKIQIPDSEWCCPKCNAPDRLNGDDGWVITESLNMDCEQLHETDLIECGRCGYILTGKGYVTWYIKNRDLIQCPCCKGLGMINKKSIN